MPKYKVVLTMTEVRTYTVESPNEGEALRRVASEYQSMDHEAPYSAWSEVTDVQQLDDEETNADV